MPFVREDIPSNLCAIENKPIEGLYVESGFNDYYKIAIVIACMCQNFGVLDVCGQIPKSIIRRHTFLPSDFPNIFSRLICI